MACQRDHGAVAVTGGAGFLGLHIVEGLARAGLSVVSLDIAQPDDLARSVASVVEGDPGSGSITFRQCDLRDLDALRAAITDGDIRDVVHAAALTNPVGRATLAMVDVHVRATQALLDLADEGSLGRVIVLSSAAVLRSPEAEGTLDEDYPATPVGSYAITKQAAERLVDDARTADGIDAVALRLPALYGPYERPTGSRNHMSIIHDAVRLALAGTALTANGAGLSRDWTRAGPRPLPPGRGPGPHPPGDARSGPGRRPRYRPEVGGPSRGRRSAILGDQPSCRSRHRPRPGRIRILAPVRDQGRDRRLRRVPST